MRRAQLLIATCALAGIIGVVLVGGARARGHLDPFDAIGSLDLRRVDVRQAVRNVALEVRTQDSFSLTQLDRRPDTSDPSARYLCLRIGRPRAGWLRKRLCFGSDRGDADGLGYAEVRADGSVRSFHQIAAEVSRPDDKTVIARFRPSSANMRPGHYRWRYLSHWSGPGCAPPAPTSEPAAKGTVEDPCQDQAPNSRLAKFHLRRVQPVGCTDHGPTPVFHGSRRHKRVALTFDDGPSSYTSSVISILRHKHAKGTFFEVGDQIPGRASLSRRIVRAGFEVANHSLHHELDPSAGSMAETSRRIKSATGFEPCLFRPPYGAYNSRVVSDARRLGMTTVIWDVDPTDWSTPGTSAIYSRVVSATHPGSIVLMHDGGGNRSQTVAALPKVISTLRHRGYEFVTVTKLLGNHFIWGPVG
jgi:peptidoglycan/xylan/chitin deacetylase (PgdA/CDA1 family)